MVRVNASRESNALPSGGRCDDGMRGVSKTVDKPESAFDRRRHTIPRKAQVPSKIFVPLDPNDAAKNPNRGQKLHSDPFNPERPNREFRRSKVHVTTPRGPQKAERRIIKGVPEPDRTGVKDGFITANGVRHLSPKRVGKESHETTLDRAQPPKCYEGSRRFQSSPTRQRTAGSTTASNAASPGARTERSVASVTSAAPSLALSNVFHSAGSIEASPANPRSTGKRVNGGMQRQVTMQGVFSPMPGGRAPKPSTLAPWMQDTPSHHSGRSIAARPTAAVQAPFAIQA